MLVFYQLNKHVQKLIFSNVGVYVGSMNYFQILNPHRVKEFLKVNEPFLRALVKEPPRTSNKGRKRIAERWVRVALALVMIAKQG